MLSEEDIRKYLERKEKPDKKLTDEELERYLEEDLEEFSEATEAELDEVECIPIPCEDPIDERDRVWERNHALITDCITEALQGGISMPTISLIVERTRLNRKTVRKHLKEFMASPVLKEQKNKYAMMVPVIMDRLFQLTMAGNVKAARLYMELMGMLKTNQVVNNNFINGNQNNNLQINGISITEDLINKLSEKDLMLVEEIFRTTSYTTVANHGQKYDGQKQ